MKTALIYLHDPSCTAITADVVRTGVDQYGAWIAPSATNACVKGGGQPADSARVDGMPVADIRLDADGLARHYIATPHSVAVGDSISITVDPGPRWLNSRYHHAGHLIAAIAQRLLPLADISRGHHYPGEGWVGGPIEGPVPDDFTETLQRAVTQAVEDGLPVTISTGAARTVQVGSYPAVPCGGTHCDSTADLHDVVIKYVRVKKRTLKISYSLADDITSDASSAQEVQS